MVDNPTELNLLCASISDAEHDIWLWNNLKPSMEERVVLAAMSRHVNLLTLIFRREVDGRPAVAEDGNWQDHAREFVTLLDRAKSIRGSTVGEHLDELAVRLTARVAPAGVGDESEAGIPSHGFQTGRSSRVDEFINKMARAGHHISRTDIWTVAGHTDATQFQRWQREDPRSTDGDNSKFNRVLSYTEERFMKELNSAKASRSRHQ